MSNFQIAFFVFVLIAMGNLVMIPKRLFLGFPVRRNFFFMLGAIAAAFLMFFPAFGY